MIGKIIVVGVVVAVAIAAAAVVFAMQNGFGGINNTAAAPDVKFVSFDADRKDIKVGETTNLIFNVQNFEKRAIDDARVIIMTESSGSEPFLSISNKTVILPQLASKDAATGEIKVTLAATGSPAKEAVYVVKGLLVVEGVQCDSRQFELKISEQE